ncbi:phage adaptor protein [Chitinilyticum litopenaei]|uniref:phage adaptor protein n=1 Tax=Chitinilyticum litopenaei TaxID=1121276 RepID=UPI00040DDADC|nr:hypothetical protein [Chitinilyticum litopenaei]
MNYLQLVQRLHAEAGLSGNPPQAVTGQSGMFAKLVNWTADAWTEIDTEPWPWRHVSVPATLLAGQSALTSAQIGKVEVITGLRHLPADVFVPSYPVIEQGQPSVWTQLLPGEVRFNRAPEVDYAAQLIGLKPQQVLAASLDVPLLPEQYHLAIVWRALMLYAKHEEVPGLYVTAERDYQATLSRAMNALLPLRVELEPLA